MPRASLLLGTPRSVSSSYRLLKNVDVLRTEVSKRYREMQYNARQVNAAAFDNAFPSEVTNEWCEWCCRRRRDQMRL